MPPFWAGLVPQRCEANDKTLQLLSFHQSLNINRKSAELDENLEKKLNFRPKSTEKEICGCADITLAVQPVSEAPGRFPLP